MNDPLSQALNEPLHDPLDEINLRMAVAASDIAELRAEIARLDRDLEESRRLNVRAAELLLLVYEQVSGAPASPGLVSRASSPVP
jgi:hypothetical protein